jgi:FkbH-like protein
LQRDDLLLDRNQIFPVEAHWHAKSASVEHILRAWNILADGVVFVDDSPMELAEVAAAHPGIECLQFPTHNDAAGYAMLRRLRDLFGKARVSREDTIRLESIRQGMAFQQVADGGPASETFLKQANAVITFDFGFAAEDPRALELVNKTNQFNLNGVRYTDADWNRHLARPSGLVAAVSYEDKFGLLGNIAVIAGQQKGQLLSLDTWVMSCRAFARRIEHQCLEMLFERYGAQEIFFEFQPTLKNGPLQDFIATIAGSRPVGPFTLSRVQFAGKCPALYHRVTHLQTSSTHG